jgi:hypothetical protein
LRLVAPLANIHDGKPNQPLLDKRVEKSLIIQKIHYHERTPNETTLNDAMIGIDNPEKERNCCRRPDEAISSGRYESTPDGGCPKGNRPFFKAFRDVVHLADRGVNDLYLELEHVELIPEGSFFRVIFRGGGTHAPNEIWMELP